MQKPRRRARRAPRVSPRQSSWAVSTYLRVNRNRVRLTICISVLGQSCSGSVVENSVADETPEGHVDDPDDKGDKGCERGREGHEDGAGARVAGAAEAKDCGEEGECGSNGVEDHSRSEVVDGGCVEAIIPGGEEEQR